MTRAAAECLAQQDNVVRQTGTGQTARSGKYGAKHHWVTACTGHPHRLLLIEFRDARLDLVVTGRPGDLCECDRV